MIQLAAEQVRDWILITDLSGTILYVNPEVEKISGYSEKELVGYKPSVLKSDLIPRKVYTRLWDTILSGKVYSNVVANRHKNGNLYYLASNITPVKDEEEKIQFFIATGRVISQDGKLEKQMHDVVHQDALTGLLNRNSFIEEVSQAQEYGENTAVIAVTINKLGLINSNYGFLCGDKVIQEVGYRIKSVLDEDCIVARPEGKVFAILFPNFKNPAKIVQMIKKIEEAVWVPIELKEEAIYISVRFGIATYPSETAKEKNSRTDADSLLTMAQLALSKVKQSANLENYEFYTDTMNQQVMDQINMENEIYTAFEDDEFIPFYQPLICLDTGKPFGLEALARRKKATGEIVPPMEFISFLEETGLIVEVGFELIEQICDQIRSWIDEFGFSYPVAINLSPVQFKDEDFCKKMRRVVTEKGISPHLITFEITESMLIEDISLTISILEELRFYGFTVSIDDFGTGYSSLSYIQKFRINRIKIDMSFIRHIVTNEVDQTIVKAIIMMAEGLKLETIAEGVETKEQLEIIKRLGCDMGQGYYWERPLPADEISSKWYKEDYT